MSISNPPHNSDEAKNIPEEMAGRRNLKTEASPEKADKASEISGTPILEVRDLCHRYPHLESNALDKINLKIFKGERVAVLGANGAGKST
ncbi:MAG: ATP-binding cassette domain-containing protein, partial [Methanosarcina sp.]|nr:ATP-binding cassette domain-containing protein [Methanosarcina sp.]